MKWYDGRLINEECLSQHTLIDAKSGKETEYTYLEQCQKSEKCRLVSDSDLESSSYGVCVKRRMYWFAGERCTVDSECFSDKCQEKQIHSKWREVFFALCLCK